METGSSARSAQAKFGDPARWQELIPTIHRSTPEQCADLVAFSRPDRASHIAGTVETIDGGAVATQRGRCRGRHAGRAHPRGALGQRDAAG